MDREEMCFDGAMIERGEIMTAEDGIYTVRSYGRDGLTTPGIPAMGEDTYTTGEKVYFFLFGDGNGMILHRFE